MANGTDYIGYVLKDDASQTLMHQYTQGSMSFENMVIELETQAQ